MMESRMLRTPGAGTAYCGTRAAGRVLAGNEFRCGPPAGRLHRPICIAVDGARNVFAAGESNAGLETAPQVT